MTEVKDKLITAESLKAAYDANKTAINKKVDIEQGVENYGKVFTVNSEGNADVASFPAQTDVVYDETKGRLVVTKKTNLPGNISVDPLLLNEGDAADAKVVGDKISELKSDILNNNNKWDELSINMTTENFTFTLEDGTEVVKEVYVKS